MPVLQDVTRDGGHLGQGQAAEGWSAAVKKISNTTDSIKDAVDIDYFCEKALKI